jgi:hydrogenase maturation protein HypF
LSVAPPRARLCALEGRSIRVGGRVQGVGYRPFVQRLAARLGLSGWVNNHAGEVHIVAYGAPERIEAFLSALVADAPPFARPHLLAVTARAGADVPSGFHILASRTGDVASAVLPPDQPPCPDCLVEMRDPNARRYRYPFINCTQCGPRYTIIIRLPYDRPNTTMAAFALCEMCATEYADPADRRYHAEPLACPTCGPQLSFRRPGGGTIDGNEPALAATVAALKGGEIVAVRGVGGYHLMCDANNDAAIARLRQRKRRPHKPLAVMVRASGEDGLDDARRLAEIDAVAARMLADPVRPIVLVARRHDAPLAAGIAPGLTEVGVMLPYSPLHLLLSEGFGRALVATSGNLSGEPVLTEVGEAEARLAPIADAFLHHDRPIVRPADDPVFRPMAGRARPIRLGRGNAPLSLTLPWPIARPTLAVGGHLKVTVALAWGDRVVISPHIGDLDSPRSRAVFASVIEDLQRLYGIRAERVVCDAHPAYASTRWAKGVGLTLKTVLHHHAHASALVGDHGIVSGRPVLVFTWDGVGYGADGTLWGGEAFLGLPGRWRRVAHLRPFRLPGGERAAREPWRSALAVCWTTGFRPPHHVIPGDGEVAMLHAAWARGLNAPATTAAGRLFDGAAALIGLAQTASFEGHAPMQLEAIAEKDADGLPLPLIAADDGVITIDWAPLLAPLCDDRLSPSARAAFFHASLALAVRDVTRRLAATGDVAAVGLTGGVFQNRRLTERTTAALQGDGFAVLLAQDIPSNDAGLSFGQIIEAIAGDGYCEAQA